ncbi:hypothetical protein GCM10010350_81640 [Streptomyces galilaeus]|nr:hypothetical protein GCM10010350_81640 [Streptomyces galilaeus]
MLSFASAVVGEDVAVVVQVDGCEEQTLTDFPGSATPIARQLAKATSTEAVWYRVTDADDASF